MAQSSAAFNLIFGAKTQQLTRALNDTQRQLRRTSLEMKDVGANMTRNLSIPLAGLGALFVKSAADLETLETSFVSLTGGVDQAAAMVKQLNEFTASTPFQLEAVAKSARQLIASGTGIDEVNGQLRFLGDIAATSGSQIDEIAAIFAKVNAKGKVELESLNQLAERGVPIFAALAEATGLPASALGAGAVSVQQFNDVLRSFSEQGGFAAGAMERLSKTTAGMASTALDNLKQAAGELGKVLLPTVNKSLKAVIALSQGFAKLQPATKTIIVAFGSLAAVTGPLINLYARFRLTQVKLTGAFKVHKTALIADAAAKKGVAASTITMRNATVAASFAMKGFRTALVSTGIGAIVVALGFAADALLTFATNSNKAGEAEGDFNNSIAEGNRQLKERNKILTGSENLDEQSISGLENRIAALNAEINNLDPADLRDALQQAGGVFSDGSDVLSGTLQNAALRLQTMLTGQDMMDAIGNTEFYVAGRGADLVVEAVNATRRALRKEIAEAQSKINELQGQGQDDTTNPVQASIEPLKRIEATAAQIKNIVGDRGLQPINPDSIVSAKVLLEQYNEELERAAQIGAVAGQITGAAFDAATGRVKDFGAAVRNIFLSLLRSALSTAIANAIASAFSPASPDNIATGGAAAPVKAIGLKAAVASLFAGIPALATGGVVTKPTLSLIGEAGAEAVIPFNRMDEFLNMTGSGANKDLRVSGRLVGNDIFLTNNRQAINSGRRRVII